jgi:hypothetical protein
LMLRLPLDYLINLADGVNIHRQALEDKTYPSFSVTISS